MIITPGEALVALSLWIDAGNAHRDPEAVTWGRIAKVSEECGEVIAAYIGATGQNPRKGVVGSLKVEVVEELLDVAVTALGAIEHVTGHHGYALARLDDKIMRVAVRAGVLDQRRNERYDAVLDGPDESTEGDVDRDR